jgi:hypothetical protein
MQCTKSLNLANKQIISDNFSGVFETVEVKLCIVFLPSESRKLSTITSWSKAFRGISRIAQI